MEYLKAKGKVIVTEAGKEVLLQGVGLGGWLLPEGYMWKFYEACDRPRRMEQLILGQCQEEFSTLFWKRYLEEYVTCKDIDMISDWGFNCVRLPLNARTLCRGEGEAIEFIPEVIECIDEFILWCKSKEIYVILDMHGAPGGQTGTNIDDCEQDKPELFMDEVKKVECIKLWGLLAMRYAQEPCIAGYDLLNEPLPDWFKQYNPQVIPLYKELIDAIRKQDDKHMIILEGVHWATDFSIFETLSEVTKDDNLVLQFHKYWSCPDQEGIQQYLNWQEKLQLPLLMGEGGENNLNWYYGMFQMLRKANISFCFWSYKKMDTTNSLISFPKPKDWDRMIEVIKGKRVLPPDEAQKLWEDFLNSISDIRKEDAVANAILGKAPLMIPAEYYSGYDTQNSRIEGAMVRESEPVSILFKHNPETIRIPDYRRFGGEAQPQEELLFIRLQPGDKVWYEFSTDHKCYDISITCRTIEQGSIKIGTSSQSGSKSIEIKPTAEWKEIDCFLGEVFEGEVKLTITVAGIIDLENIKIGMDDKAQNQD